MLGQENEVAEVTYRTSKSIITKTMALRLSFYYLSSHFTELLKLLSTAQYKPLKSDILSSHAVKNIFAWMSFPLGFLETSTESFLCHFATYCIEHLEYLLFLCKSMVLGLGGAI